MMFSSSSNRSLQTNLPELSNDRNADALDSRSDRRRRRRQDRPRSAHPDHYRRPELPLGHACHASPPRRRRSAIRDDHRDGGGDAGGAGDLNLHAAARAARVGSRGRRRRSRHHARKAAGRDVGRSTGTRRSRGGKRRRAPRHLAFARGRSGGALHDVARRPPDRQDLDRVEGGRSRLAPGSGMDLG